MLWFLPKAAGPYFQILGSSSPLLKSMVEGLASSAVRQVRFSTEQPMPSTCEWPKSERQPLLCSACGL